MVNKSFRICSNALTLATSILAVNEANDAMPLAKSFQIGCSDATVEPVRTAAAPPMSKVVNRPV